MAMTNNPWISYRLARKGKMYRPNIPVMPYMDRHPTAWTTERINLPMVSTKQFFMYLDMYPYVNDYGDDSSVLRVIWQDCVAFIRVPRDFRLKMLSEHDE